MISRDSVDTLLGATAYSINGDGLGRIGRISLDNDTGQQTVNVDVRKEQIDMESDPTAGRRRDDNL